MLEVAAMSIAMTAMESPNLFMPNPRLADHTMPAGMLGRASPVERPIEPIPVRRCRHPLNLTDPSSISVESRLPCVIVRA
jgi:hypothetical protein